MSQPVDQELELGTAIWMPFKGGPATWALLASHQVRELFMAFVCAQCLSSTRDHVNNALFTPATEQQTD